MSDTWYAAFALLTLLSLLNATLLVGALRQIGVLHQRIPAMGPGKGGIGDGPRLGQLITLPDVSLVAGRNSGRPFGASLNLVGYIDPDCTICHELPQFFTAYSRTKDPALDLMSLLVTEAPHDASRAFVDATGIGSDLALYRGDQVRAGLHAPGSPYVLALTPRDNENQAVVLAAGVVNTLEQLEELVAEAVANGEGDPAVDAVPVMPSVLEARSNLTEPNHVHQPIPQAKET